MSRGEDAPVTRVGVVGLGDIGTGVARAVARGGFAVVGYDVRPESVAALDDAVRPASSIAQVGDECDVVLVAVWSGEQASDVVDQLLRTPAPPRIIAILSTVSVPTIERLAERAATGGARVLDCGVTGGGRLREHGKILVMVGGEDAVLAAARPVLETFGDPVVHAGPLGAGMRAKLARNMIVYGTWCVVLEAARVAAAGGVEIATLAHIVETADRWKRGAAEALHNRALVAPPADEGERAELEHIMGTVHKDLRAAIDAADELGVDAELARFVDRYIERLIPVDPLGAPAPQA
jgi:3-hydroxyisobutyrate dehydrogenase-like beta-hydroxyacid dehydrogenase